MRATLSLNLKTKDEGNVSSREELRPNVHHFAQVAHTPRSISYEPPRAWNPGNRDALVGHLARERRLKLRIALLMHLATSSPNSPARQASWAESTLKADSVAVSH